MKCPLLGVALAAINSPVVDAQALGPPVQTAQRHGAFALLLMSEYQGATGSPLPGTAPAPSPPLRAGAVNRHRRAPRRDARREGHGRDLRPRHGHLDLG